MSPGSRPNPIFERNGHNRPNARNTAPTMMKNLAIQTLLATILSVEPDGDKTFDRESLGKTLRRHLKTLSGAFFERRCLGCSRTGVDQALCPDCLAQIEYPSEKSCAKCLEQLDFDYDIDPLDENRIDHFVCLSCQPKRYHYHAARAATIYSTPIQELIQAFKFNNQRQLLGRIVEISRPRLLDWLTDRARRAPILVPTPMAAGRLFRRGYNHAYLIAREYARALDAPVAPDICSRTRQTRAQYNLTIEERRANLRGAFRLDRPESVRGRDVIIFDDIFTTGSTVRELARTIKKGKPNAIFVAVIAKTRRFSS